eukprot:4900413-Pyramimonas_sp.AAC.1
MFASPVMNDRLSRRLKITGRDLKTPSSKPSNKGSLSAARCLGGSFTVRAGKCSAAVARRSPVATPF